MWIDGDDASVALTAGNFERNGFVGREEVKSMRYLWGDATDLFGEVDVIVASDVVACPYVQHFGELRRTIRRLFAVNNVTKMLLVYERRAEVEER